MQFVQHSFRLEKYNRLDFAAMLLVSLILVITVLFPENFISGLPFFATRNSFPLTLFLPIMVAAMTLYILRRREYIKVDMVGGLVLIFFAYTLARNISGPEYLATIKYFVYGIGLFYLTAIISTQKEAMLNVIVYVIAGLVLLTAIYGMLEYGIQKNIVYYDYIIQTVPDPRIGLHRVGSTLAHPVAYGAFLIQGLPFFLIVWMKLRARVKSLWSLALFNVAILLAVLALFFTYSKGSWIVAVLLAICLFLSLRTSITRSIILPAIIVVVMLAIMLGVFWDEVRTETEARAQSSIEFRWRTWQTTLDSFSDHPVTGVGIKQGKEELQKHKDLEYFQYAKFVMPVDNYYLSLLLEAGVIGCSIWLMFQVLILREAIKVVRVPGHGRTLAMAALFSLLGLCLNSVTFESMLIWPNFVLFWIAAGMTHGLFWNLDETQEYKRWQGATI